LCSAPRRSAPPGTTELAATIATNLEHRPPPRAMLPSSRKLLAEALGGALLPSVSAEKKSLPQTAPLWSSFGQAGTTLSSTITPRWSMTPPPVPTPTGPVPHRRPLRPTMCRRGSTLSGEPSSLQPLKMDSLPPSLLLGRLPHRRRRHPMRHEESPIFDLGLAGFGPK
jgi:hypothetical protein